MKSPPLAQVVLLFFVGGVFLHFLLAGARAFHSKNMEDEPGGPRAQAAFLLGGTVPAWFLGLYLPVRLTNGIVAGVVLVLSIALYEWARHTIRGRRFGVGWGDHVPETLCTDGPYARIRNPIYLAYMLAFLAAAIALPHWVTAASLVANIALFAHAARSDDERRIAESPLAQAYVAYRARTGMFLPRFSRAAPGKSPP